ncbi:MAG: GerMN domain-containing protein, partial [Microbacteriaceae bacterium]|nr:GerMN domain-containing protein [Microbacteriaceae bacterium]
MSRMDPRNALRALGVALAAALAAALSACVGIPVSGPVVAGPVVGENEPDFVLNPSGPAVGADPTGILNGFMAAVRAPQSDYKVARLFLTPQLAQTWEPDAGVIIWSSAPSLANRGTAEAPFIDYAFETRASVDADGRYRASAAPAPRTLGFAFTQVDGQWRISAAPDGVVLGEAGFSRAFTEYALYFFDPTGRYLVPDVRWFAARQTTPSVVVTALLGGPDAWLRHAVISDFPAGTTLGPRSVVLNAGRATVDLSPEVASASPQQLDRMRQQLVQTLDVADVTITADGVPLRTDSSETPATVDPHPEGTVLVGTGTEFGHAGADGITPIEGVSEAIVADGATAAVVAASQTSAAYLAADGTVRRVTAGVTAVLDTRGSLVAPALDEFGWVWSAGALSPLEAFDVGGEPAGLLVDAIPPDASIVALAVSRDSTRLAVALRSPAGPRLLVFGIVRVNGAPTSLDPPLELPAAGAIASIAWADDRSLV